MFERNAPLDGWRQLFPFHVQHTGYVSSLFDAFVTSCVFRAACPLNSHPSPSLVFPFTSHAPLLRPIPCEQDDSGETNRGAYVDASPTVADLDMDGKLEVLVGTVRGELHVLDASSGCERSAAAAELLLMLMMMLMLTERDGRMLRCFVAKVERRSLSNVNASKKPRTHALCERLVVYLPGLAWPRGGWVARVSCLYFPFACDAATLLWLVSVACAIAFDRHRHPVGQSISQRFDPPPT